jgi:uncharacterized repeat protein (TIGR03803 family)
LCAAILATAFALALPAQAQTFTVLHNFTGGADGATPYAGLTIDRAGNFYGTAEFGGYMGQCCGTGCGTVFKLSRAGSGWTITPIYAFQGFYTGDGAEPIARVTFGPDGALYGATSQGGSQECSYSDCGIVFRLTPQATACKTALCPWTETILHTFLGGQSDGAFPGTGDVVFDSTGNLYGTTGEGGGGMCDDYTCGTVYEVSPSRGGWTESLIFHFGSPSFFPNAGLTLDGSGNLYGTTTNINGAVYELEKNGGGWRPESVFDFTNSPEFGLYGGVTFDSSGNLYGTTAGGGPGDGGTVFELTPSGGSWTMTILYSFTGTWHNTPPGPTSTLTMDASGALYGDTHTEGAYGYGNIFKLTPSQGGWTYTSLHDFTGGSDGGFPWGQVILDANGNIYGTTTAGGSTVGSCYQNLGCGVVFEITP